MKLFGSQLVLEETLGSGGMGTVYRARLLGHADFSKTVAVKVLTISAFGSPDFGRLFANEMSLCAKLSHKNVIQVFFSGCEAGQVFLVMEYLDGMNLRTLLKATEKSGKELGPAACCYIISEAAKGLAYAHRFRDPASKAPLEIIHRDVSPQNIMVTYDGSIKLIDFGIAKFSGRADITRPGVVRGKASYMSPEQIDGKELDHRSDLFSLGAVFYELLTGIPLFKGRDAMESAQLVKTLEIVPPSKASPSAPEALDWTILNLLHRDRSERASSAQGLADELDRYLHYQHPQWTSRSLFEFVEAYLK
jgi:serine/threonine protein kinase